MEIGDFEIVPYKHHHFLITEFLITRVHMKLTMVKTRHTCFPSAFGYFMFSHHLESVLCWRGFGSIL